MIVSEDYAKNLLASYGLSTPAGRVVHTPDEAADFTQELGGFSVLKALIPTGGRGKAGGVQVCRSVEQARHAAGQLLGSEILGYQVAALLVEQMVAYDREIYASIILNTATDKIDLMVSFTGGVEIENTAREVQGSILLLTVEPGDVLPVHRVRRWLEQNRVNSADISPLAGVLVNLYRAAADLDAILLEINPLAVCHDGRLMLLDCKLEVDNSGLARQPGLNEYYLQSLSQRELLARRLGVSYVALDGDIGVITSGAGLGMATLDMLKSKGLTPANFLDTGGGISEQMVKGALELIMEPPQVRGAIINLYGGINRMLEAAKGITSALDNIPGSRPVVVKILGNQQEESWAMLESVPDVHVIRVVQTEAAVERLASLLN